MKKLLIMTAFLSAMMTGCERVDHTGEIHSKPSPYLPLDEVARMLSALPIEKVQDARSAQRCIFIIFKWIR